MAGEPFVSNVAEGAALAEALNPGLVIFEGSGAAVPPVGTDARLLVAGAHQPLEYVAGYLGTYRVLTSDALVLTMAEEPMATREKVEAIIQAARDIKIEPTMVVPVVFRPRPCDSGQGSEDGFLLDRARGPAARRCGATSRSATSAAWR